MSKKTITLYSVVWNEYWDKYGMQWSECINNLNTTPDQIIIVSDKEIDISVIKNTNVLNIVTTIKPNISDFRNIAINNSKSDWIVASDVDDIPFSNYLDNLDDDADIHAFSFIDTVNNIRFEPKADCLNVRLMHNNGFNTNLIPGTSAIKKHVFDRLRYESQCFEDLIFYSMASKIELKVSFDNDIRFAYTGSHPTDNNLELTRVSEIYRDILKEKRKLYCAWFSKEMTTNRKKSLRILQENSGVDVVLINNDNFYEYENSEIPIHKGFFFLSDVDKADYVKAYIMYFYGGGYTDIKSNSFDWNPYFDELFLSNSECAGYAEKSPEHIAVFYNEDNVKNFIYKNYNKFIGMGHFIFKPKTKLAFSWISAVHKLLDDKYEILKENPGLHPYAVLGGIHESFTGYCDPSLINKKYPFEWTDLCGTILHKLQYDQRNNSILNTMPYVNMDSYR